MPHPRGSGPPRVTAAHESPTKGNTPRATDDGGPGHGKRPRQRLGEPSRSVHRQPDVLVPAKGFSRAIGQSVRTLACSARDRPSNRRGARSGRSNRRQRSGAKSAARSAKGVIGLRAPGHPRHGLRTSAPVWRSGDGVRLPGLAHYCSLLPEACELPSGSGIVAELVRTDGQVPSSASRRAFVLCGRFLAGTLI